MLIASMRLINTTTFELKELLGMPSEPYAILSHCWGEEEISFERYGTKASATGAGFRKIVSCCFLATKHNTKWVWVDTCCIDKRSSAELSEAINSMYKWYEYAQICFVFLHDFDASAMGDMDAAAFKLRLGNCKWWTRGWTLQELLAPSQVLFYGPELEYLGSKSSLSTIITEFTKIDKDFLLRGAMESDTCVAQRMSWASKRRTTREEDIAYCLLGLFEVNMPLLYGEGNRAFFRLQAAIIAQSTDDSIFACRAPRGQLLWGILAESPSAFVDSHCIRQTSRFDRPVLPYQLTNAGLEISAPPTVIQFAESDLWFKPRKRFEETTIELGCFHQASYNAKPRPVVIGLQTLGMSGVFYRNSDLSLHPPPGTKSPFFDRKLQLFMRPRTLYIVLHTFRPTSFSELQRQSHLLITAMPDSSLPRRRPLWKKFAPILLGWTLGWTYSRIVRWIYPDMSDTLWITWFICSLCLFTVPPFFSMLWTALGRAGQTRTFLIFKFYLGSMTAYLVEFVHWIFGAA